MILAQSLYHKGCDNMFFKKKNILLLVLVVGVILLSLTFGSPHLLAHAPEYPW